jgi:hypothetical protein
LDFHVLNSFLFGIACRLAKELEQFGIDFFRVGPSDAVWPSTHHVQASLAAGKAAAATSAPPLISNSRRVNAIVSSPSDLSQLSCQRVIVFFRASDCRQLAICKVVERNAN